MEGSLHASWGGRASIQLYAVPHTAISHHAERQNCNWRPFCHTGHVPCARPVTKHSILGSSGETARHIPQNENSEQQDHNGQIESYSAEIDRRNNPAQELHGRVGDRENRLEHDDDEPAGPPISRKRSDELDDDSADQQEPKKKQYDVDHREHNHRCTLPDFSQLSKARWSQLRRTDRMAHRVTVDCRTRSRQCACAPEVRRRHRQVRAETLWSPPCRKNHAVQMPDRQQNRPASSRRRCSSPPDP